MDLSLYLVCSNCILITARYEVVSILKEAQTKAISLLAVV